MVLKDWELLVQTTDLTVGVMKKEERTKLKLLKGAIFFKFYIRTVLANRSHFRKAFFWTLFFSMCYWSTEFLENVLDDRMSIVYVACPVL